MDIVRERNELSVSVVSGDHDRASALCSLLGDLDLHAVQADFTHSSDVILFDLKSCRPGLVDDLVEYAVAKDADRPLLATLGGFEDDSPIPDEIDVRLSLDAALVLASARFRFARRIIARRAEASLRAASFSRFGVSSSFKQPTSVRPILYVGDVSRIFPALQKALEARDHDLTAALSAYTAFDYLHDTNFDAIVLDATSPAINAESFCDMINRSPGLADLPMLVLVDPAEFFGDAVVQRASDFMHRDADPDLVAEQLVHLRRLLPPVTQAFSPPCADVTDPATGLFSRPFFEDHLSMQIQWAQERQQPMSLVVIRVASIEEEHIGADLAHTAKVVRSLLRAQDAPCRLDWSRIAVSLPGADKLEAATAAQRICDVMDATAFEMGYNKPARQVSVQCRIASLAHGMEAADLLEEAIRLDEEKSTYAA